MVYDTYRSVQADHGNSKNSKCTQENKVYNIKNNPGRRTKNH